MGGQQMGTVRLDRRATNGKSEVGWECSKREE